MGWGQTVVGHMPWGALSGSPRVQGHERVFWGLCCGFRAPVVQYMQYMQILITYIYIQANTHWYVYPSIMGFMEGKVLEAVAIRIRVGRHLIIILIKEENRFNFLNVILPFSAPADSHQHFPLQVLS
jgi:hypothetical protein